MDETAHRSRKEPSMSKYKVIVSDYVFENFDVERNILSKIDAELIPHQCKSAEELKSKVKEADVILNTYLGPIDREIFQNAPKLKGVVRYGIGVDTINLDDARSFGIKVANVPDYCINEVSDHAISLYFALSRKLLLSDKKVKSGQWSLSYLKPIQAFYTQSAFIIGFGRIGQTIAKKLIPFGPKIYFYDPFIDQSPIPDVEKIDFDKGLELANVIFIQCPLTRDTYHLFNNDTFAKIKKSPMLINTARGGIIDTDALIKALKDGKISSAGLDVIENEDRIKQPDFELKNFDNVILTPHSAWYSQDSISNLQRLAAEEVVRILKNQNLRSPVVE